MSANKKDKFFGELDEVVVEDTTVEAVVEAAPLEEVVVEDTTVNDEDVNLSHTAIGLYRDTRGRYQIAKIMFDPATGATGSIDSSIEAAMDRMTAEETFKLTVVRENIFSN